MPFLRVKLVLKAFFKDPLHNSSRVRVGRIGMGCKADLAANSLGYCQEIQRRRPPEPGLSRAARSYAEGP